jgi:hypothetical protein
MGILSKKKNNPALIKSLKNNNQSKTSMIRFSGKKKKKIKKINCKNIEELLSPPGKPLTMLGEGSYGIAFQGCVDDSCEEQIGLKLISLSRKYTINNRHPGKIELNIGLSLSKLYYKNITPHINLVYGGLQCKLEDLKENMFTIQNTDWLSNKNYNILNNINNRKYHDDVMVVFNEKADSDFKKYYQKNRENNTPITYEENIICLFTFCYTLASIQYHIPGFRHNDIKPNNLLISVNNNYDNEKGKFVRYKIFGKEFYIPVIRFTLKLHDFDFCNSDEFKNEKIHTFDKNGFYKIGTNPAHNPCFDLHEYINFFFRDCAPYESDPIILNTLRQLIDNPSQDITGIFGKDNDYTTRYKLTSYKMTENMNIPLIEKSNYIPPNMKTPSELLLSFEEFRKYLNKNQNQTKDVIRTYDSKIELSKEHFKRDDMFNTLLSNKK